MNWFFAHESCTVTLLRILMFLLLTESNGKMIFGKSIPSDIYEIWWNNVTDPKATLIKWYKNDIWWWFHMNSLSIGSTKCSLQAYHAWIGIRLRGLRTHIMVWHNSQRISTKNCSCLRIWRLEVSLEHQRIYQSIAINPLCTWVICDKSW